MEYELTDSEGNWKSEKQAFKIAFTNNNYGVITFYEQGVAIPVQFEYKKTEFGRVMMLVGAEQKPISIRLDDINSLGYER
ncbi:hypothetical protein [Paenibacillus sp. GCM10012306]|uniref:hypothetical protein n=1 Tax=Paenibacillus sp. GCM10012306 TaxID=3317342 RepID=UPI00360BE5D5